MDAHNRRVEAERKAFEDEQKRLARIDMLGLGAEALSAMARDAGAAPRMRNVVLEQAQVRLTLVDPRAGGELVTYRYDRRKALTRLDSREADITRCGEAFSADDFEWALVPQLVEQAFVAIGIERDAEIRVDVERPDSCGPPHAQVSLEKNRRTIGAFFDRAGRLYRVE